MTTGVHFLLTYSCPYECDHCFLYCGPQAEGTFTIGQIRQVFDECDRHGGITSVFFEGGEPFLYHPLLIEGVRLAKERKLWVGIVTNAFYANSVDDAMLWLKPLKRLEIDELSISDDEFHRGSDDSPKGRNAQKAATQLGLPESIICIEKPLTLTETEGKNKGKPIVGGNVRFRGRAVEKLAEGLPTLPSAGYQECPYEELRDPDRVHIDCFGNVHLCQGISMGNMWKTPLSKLLKEYRADNHPICGPLLRGGPAELAKTYGVEVDEGYVDACHMCFMVRKSLLDRFPDFLTPKQVYGL